MMAAVKRSLIVSRNKRMIKVAKIMTRDGNYLCLAVKMILVTMLLSFPKFSIV